MMQGTKFIPLLLLHHAQSTEEERLYQEALQHWSAWRRDTQILHAALMQPRMSAWAYLFGSGNDQALISMTGFDHASFCAMEDLFTPVYNSYTPYTKNNPAALICKLSPRQRWGQPWLLDGRLCLGLVLTWTHTRGAEQVLSVMFGVTGTPISKWIVFGRRVLVRVLQKHPHSCVCFPHSDVTATMMQAVHDRHPHLPFVAFTANGVKLYIESAGLPATQMMFYNGWTHDTYVSCVLVFAMNGTIVVAGINAPGAWHDSTIAEYCDVYVKLEAVFELCSARTVIDSAFSHGRYPFLIKSANETNACTAHELLECRDATAMHQTAEWGMRGFQGSFPRLKDRLSYEELGEHKIIQQLCILLYNFQSQCVGINKLLKNVYMENLNVEILELFPGIDNV